MMKRRRFIMARASKRLPANVAGDFFVDRTCINCDACRELAPAIFCERDDASAVYHQPDTAEERHQAYLALVTCPVGAIGSQRPDRDELHEAVRAFPQPIYGSVFYNGFNSEKSFGAHSYFVQHEAGNWLIDAPRYTGRLVEAFERMGGVRYIFLSHADDGGDAGRYAKRFGAVRLIHEADAEAMPDAERILRGDKSVGLDDQVEIIPVPGHTMGSLALLYARRYLFTGDHLWWDPEDCRLDVPSVYVCSHRHLLTSTERLLTYPFEWVLPGHGHRIHLPFTEM